MDYKTSTKVIGFDLDQTLYPKSSKIDEAIQKYLYKQIAKHRGCSVQEAKSLFKKLYRQGERSSGTGILKYLKIPNPEQTVQTALEKADILSFLEPDSKVNKMLQQLKEKYFLDLITGSASSETFKKLKALEIPQDTFHNIITADEYSKSDGSSFKEWLCLYPEFRPQQFLYIGDRVSSDHIIPRSFNISSILVNIENPSKQGGLVASCPVLSCLQEIEKYLL